MMNTENQNDYTEIYKAAVQLWGKSAQTAMMEEEAQELAMAVHKFIHRGGTSDQLYEVGKEIADVLNVIDQMFLMYPELVSTVEIVRHDKMMRLRTRIKKNDFEFKP